MAARGAPWPVIRDAYALSSSGAVESNVSILTQQIHRPQSVDRGHASLDRLQGCSGTKARDDAEVAAASANQPRTNPGLRGARRTRAGPRLDQVRRDTLAGSEPCFHEPAEPAERQCRRPLSEIASSGCSRRTPSASLSSSPASTLSRPFSRTTSTWISRMQER